MGGLCAGSILLPRFVPRSIHPLKLYAALELGIGILGVLVLFAVPLVARLYVHGVPDSPTAGFTGIVLRGIVAGACLLPPTLLMGASLPAIARWLEPTRAGGSWMWWRYSINIAGAVLGALMSGFYLMRVHDMAVATYAAAAINLAVGGLSFIISSRTTYEGIPGDDRSRAARVKRVGYIYIAIA